MKGIRKTHHTESIFDFDRLFGFLSIKFCSVYLFEKHSVSDVSLEDTHPSSQPGLFGQDLLPPDPLLLSALPMEIDSN